VLTIRLSPEDLSRVRFAFSPLWETVASFRVLLDPGRHALFYEVREVLSNVVDWPLWSRGDLLLVSFYQLPIPELGSGSYERHQMMSV
jgi:hypothetical protein